MIPLSNSYNENTTFVWQKSFAILKSALVIRKNGE